MSVRVRFAPSPTGYLHIGGARTALFNWLYARHTGGTFVLRIEDTDAARNTQAAVDIILNGLRWLGLDWDEGPVTGDATGPSRGACGPYFQSQRHDIYRQRVQELRDRGFAYEDQGAIRFRMERNPVIIPDLIVGEVRRELTDREAQEPDFVIVRSDGQPVFHLVNVIDDLEMGITHVIRGEDHLANTAKHLALFRAFGVEAPQYAHIPLILNLDGTKMSKRDQGASLSTYIEGGFVPDAVVNYLCLLGWSPKDDSEIMPIAEVVRRFDLPQVLRHNARFDMKKLSWMNWEYIKHLAEERFEENALRALARAGISTEGFSPEYRRAALLTVKEKLKLFTDAPAIADFYFLPEVAVEPAAQKDLSVESRRVMEWLRPLLASAPHFTADALGALLKQFAVDRAIKIGQIVHPLRLACTGRGVGPSLYHLMEVLGRERVLARLDRFVSQCPLD
jgi:nondiscriminating glutamyl-tRNA synthetase